MSLKTKIEEGLLKSVVPEIRLLVKELQKLYARLEDLEKKVNVK